MRAQWPAAAVVLAAIGPLCALVVAASYLGRPWMLAAATLCFALTFVLAAVATPMLRRLRPEDTVPVRLTLLHGYVGFLPAVGLILGAAAIAPLVGIHQGHDLVYTSRGWIFLLACFIVGGSLYRALLGLAGREWRALVRRLEVEDPPAHGANGDPSFP